MWKLHLKAHLIAIEWSIESKPLQIKWKMRNTKQFEQTYCTSIILYHGLLPFWGTCYHYLHYFGSKCKTSFRLKHPNLSIDQKSKQQQFYYDSRYLFSLREILGHCVIGDISSNFSVGLFCLSILLSLTLNPIILN